MASRTETTPLYKFERVALTTHKYLMRDRVEEIRTRARQQVKRQRRELEAGCSPGNRERDGGGLAAMV